jgi:putative membrane protein
MSDLNDPRVFFAAERTALAWNRTALTLMAFGFAIERFGLFVQMLLDKNSRVGHSGPSFWFGLIFIVLGCFFSFTAAQQYKNILKTLKPVEIPVHSNPHLAFFLNVIIAVLAMTMIACGFRGMPISVPN